MTREELIEKLIALKPRLEAEGVRHLELFGSRARGDHRPDSDVDVLVDLDGSRPISILGLIGIQHIIGDHLGLEANATLRGGLKDRLKSSIERDAMPIF